MVEPIPELSVGEKDSLIVRLFGELDALRGVVEDLQFKVASLEAENKTLRGKLAKNSQNSSKPPSSDGYQNRSPRACVSRVEKNRAVSQGIRRRVWKWLKNRITLCRIPSMPVANVVVHSSR